jgi:hypothetical protein
MFARIFKNSFIIDSSVPSQIQCNYEVSTDLLGNDYDVDAPLKHMEEYENNSPTSTKFFQVEDVMFNPILQRFCLRMGLDYPMYESIINHSKLYGLLCCRTYQPNFSDAKFVKIEPRTWSIAPQSIPWNYGILPLEYWINHVGYDEYATKVYNSMLKKYIEEDKLVSRLANIDRYVSDTITLEEFINDKNNMCFNDEFNYLLFNKNLMNLLRERKFILRGIKSDITEEFLEDYNKNHYEGEVKYYADQPVY